MDRGAQVLIEWVPGHAGVPGNEFADQWAGDTVRWEKGGASPRSDGMEERVSLAFLKAERKKKAVKEWREEIIRRCKGSRAFRTPTEGEVPRIPLGLGTIPKEVTSRFFQLMPGHALSTICEGKVWMVGVGYLLVVWVSQAGKGASLERVLNLEGKDQGAVEEC